MLIFATNCIRVALVSIPCFSGSHDIVNSVLMYEFYAILNLFDLIVRIVMYQ